MLRPYRINPRSDRPAWKQIVDNLKHQIAVGNIEPGELLPSEADLADDYFDSSVNTIRQALDYLRREEIIVTAKGKGSVVALPQEPVEVTLPPSATATIRTSTEDEAEALDLPMGALVVEITVGGRSQVVKALGTILRSAQTSSD